jgi:DNA-binding GntR family transcriptional regulator
LNTSEELPKVQRPDSLKNIAFKTIKDSIINGSLLCGKIYSENVVSKNMGISKTPVHEALLELSHKGFIEILPKKGFLVKDLSEKEVRDIYGFRLALERVIVINAAAKAGEKDIIFLGSLLTKIKGSRDVMMFMEEAIHFHRYLARLNGNEQIIKALNGIWDLCVWIGFKTLSPDNVLDEILDLHFVLLDHIKNKDAKAAEKIIEEHINNSLNRILMAQFHG